MHARAAAGMLVQVETHPLARTFAGVADAYERGRPGYPAEAVAGLGLGPGKTVVDVGAGTGKLTRVLLATGAAVVAVEPLDEMRALLGRLDGVDARAGSAEALPLPDTSADAVVAGQAFHWFRAAEALPEIHRVLRPGGLLALLWNRLDLDDPFSAALAAVLERHRAHPARDREEWREAVDGSRLFGPLARTTARHAQPVDADALADRVLSESSIAILPPREREEALAEARSLGGRGATLRYVTEAWVAARR